MIAHLRGKVIGKHNGQVVVDVGGVGYLLNVPATTLERLPSPGEDVSLHTVFIVREDSMSLYGFTSTDEREAFERLLGVSAVGPKSALAVVSTLGCVGLTAAVEGEDTATLSRVPGIGKKTAGRIILELRGKLASGIEAGLPQGATASTPAQGSVEGEAIVALEVLGYSAAEAMAAVAAARRRLGGQVSVEALIRDCLKDLAG